MEAWTLRGMKCRILMRNHRVTVQGSVEVQHSSGLVVGETKSCVGNEYLEKINYVHRGK